MSDYTENKAAPSHTLWDVVKPPSPDGGKVYREAKYGEEPRQAGAVAAQACADKAERETGFDSEKAGEFVLDFLRKQGETPGESLVNQAVAAGHRPHDHRAFGAVFQRLVRRGLIACAGFTTRSKGHGTAGGRIWKAL
jgi:hypothetical protein